MSDFKFNCPHCEQSLEAPEEMLGQTIECPSCNGTIELPKPDPQPEPDPPVELRTPVQSTPSPPPPKQTKDCPFCGEEILASARKCKHCGEFLDGSSRPTSSAPQKKTAGPEKKIWEGHPSGLYYLGHWIFGILLLPVFGLGLLFIIYAILDQRTRVFTHTTRKVIAKVGIISRKTHEVAIRDIRSINMNQSILERIFGLGSVQIGSAGTGGVEVDFKGITKPAKVRDAIRKTKDETDG
jgi:membrane protein YdbS with pleckstrin-like domain